MKDLKKDLLAVKTDLERQRVELRKEFDADPRYADTKFILYKGGAAKILETSIARIDYAVHELSDAISNAKRVLSLEKIYK